MTARQVPGGARQVSSGAHQVPGSPRQVSGGARQVPDFAEKVLGVVEGIPPGRVMTYGDIAEYLGEGGGPRQVGRVLALWGGAVAWWRVLRADGSFLTGHEPEALARYQEEGTPLRRSSGGAALGVDMRRARWPGRGEPRGHSSSLARPGA